MCVLAITLGRGRCYGRAASGYSSSWETGLSRLTREVESTWARDIPSVTSSPR